MEDKSPKPTVPPPVVYDGPEQLSQSGNQTSQNVKIAQHIVNQIKNKEKDQ